MSDFKVFYTVDGVSLNDSVGRWLLEGGSRRRVLPSVRATRVTTPGRNGSAFIPNDTFDDGRFVLSIIVTDKDSNGVRGGAVQAERNVEQLSALLTGTGRLVLVEYHTGPTQKRTAYGRVTAGSEPEPRGPLLDRYLVRFVVEVPGVFWSDGAGPQLVEGAAPSASGALPLLALSGGSAPVTDAVVRFKGPFNGLVSVRDVGGGAAYAWTGTPDASTSTMTTAAGTITNLDTNPSFEATSGTVEVARNLALNPRGAVTGWWAGQVGGFFTPSTLNGRHAALVTRGANNSPFVAPAVLETRGKIVYVRAVVSPTADTVGKKVGIFGFDGTVVGPTAIVTMGAVGSETVINFMSNRPVQDTRDVVIYIDTTSSDVSWQEGQQYFVTDIVISTEPIPYYFDGSTSPDPDLTPSWTGPVNNSPSVLTGNRVAGTGVGWQSSQWAATGDFSHYIPDGSVQDYVIAAGESFQIQPRADGQTYIVNGDPYVSTDEPINITGPALIETGAGWWDNLMTPDQVYDGPFWDGSTQSTVAADPTGLDFQGTVGAGQYVFLNAETLRAHTSTSPTAWDTGTDVSGGLDYPPAGPLQITPAAQADGTHYAVAYTLPAAKNVADAVAIRAERKFI